MAGALVPVTVEGGLGLSGVAYVPPPLPQSNVVLPGGTVTIEGGLGVSGVISLPSAPIAPPPALPSGQLGRIDPSGLPAGLFAGDASGTGYTVDPSGAHQDVVVPGSGAESGLPSYVTVPDRAWVLLPGAHLGLDHDFFYAVYKDGRVEYAFIGMGADIYDDLGSYLGPQRIGPKSADELLAMGANLDTAPRNAHGIPIPGPIGGVDWLPLEVTPQNTNFFFDVLGPQVIFTLLTLGVGSVAAAGAAGTEAGAASDSLTAADTAGGLTPQFGTQAAYNAGIASSTPSAVELAPLVSPDTVTLPSGIVDVTPPPVPELGAGDLEAIQNAAALPPATSLSSSLDLTSGPPLTSSSTITPPPTIPSGIVDVTLPPVPELGTQDLAAISSAAGGGAAAGSLLPQLLKGLGGTALKKFTGAGAASSAPTTSRQAITPADSVVTEDWSHPDVSGVATDSQFQVVAALLLAVSVFFWMR